MQLTRRQQAIAELIADHSSLAVSRIREMLPDQVSVASLNRDLARLVESGFLVKQGGGRATVYHVAASFNLFAARDVDAYFVLGPDERRVKARFSFGLIDLLGNTQLFSKDELHQLRNLQQEYRRNITSISPVVHRKELERLTIELSWKSSEIEGNTYSLLETERLLIEHKEAEGKSREEAIMLLNHKSCIDYIAANTGIGRSVSLAVIENLHSLLIKDLGVSRNIRLRMVGITGTSYRPLDNEHQIKDAVDAMCKVINAKDNVFERALLAVMLVSYIQPFEDGNKRTGRMVSNAILMAGDACPLSFRSVDSLEYKKAMLLFYEQHNLSAFKQIFLQQIEFAVKNYFR